MAAENNEAEDTGISPEDYESIIKIDPKKLLLIFLVIAAIIGSLLFGFHYIQRHNSNLKVEEARVIINRGDTLPTSPTPETLELEEMVAGTEKDVNWLVDQLVADSFAANFDNQLKKKYRQRMYYSSREQLPPNWKDNLPAELEKWRRQKTNRRRAQVNYLLQELDGFLSRQRKRLQRLEEIRGSLKEEGEMPPIEQRYMESRKRFKEHLNAVESALDDAEAEGPKIPPPLYQALAKLVDSLGKITLQYRRISALTSAPTSLLYAEQYLQDALRINPWNPEALYQLGRVYEKMGKDVISSEYYLRMIKEDPSYYRVSDVVAKFEKFTEENPNSPRALYDLGFAYYEVGRHKDSLVNLLKVIENECNLKSTEFIIDAYEAGNYAEAKKLVDELISRSGCESESMTQVLARERIGYVLEGEPPYHKMSYH